MSEVAFHFNVPDRLAYICRLSRKAVGAGATLLITGPAELLLPLDRLLWTFAPQEFIPHCRSGATATQRALSPVVLAQSAQDRMDRSALVNLHEEVPEGALAFPRIIEVVGLDETERQLARQRWRSYTQLGCPIVRHDIQSAPA